MPAPIPTANLTTPVPGSSPAPSPALSARDRILQTAHDLFYAEGLRATGVDRVIAEAGVTKVTFYRHFPSKNDLILAYLNLRHAQWLAWFQAALARHGGASAGVRALAPALQEWFSGQALGDFRGCAFLNGVSEMGPVLPSLLDITREHKQQMTDALETLLPASAQRRHTAHALATAVDGAIVQAQYSGDPVSALQALELLTERLTGQP